MAAALAQPAAAAVAWVAMTRSLRRLGRTLVRLIAVAALELTTVAISPPAALAATCWDQIKDNPTPVRSGPGSAYSIVEWKHPSQQVTSPCVVVFNTTDNNLWYAAHFQGHYAYIWVGHLNYMSQTGNCYPILCKVYYTSRPPPPILV